MQLSFTKLHGLGNDFVVIEDFDNTLELSAEQVTFLCDRHFGIGADGVILVRSSEKPECAGYMHYINSDGTLAEMCGNGIRCFAKYLVDTGRVSSTDHTFWADTLRGPLQLSYETTSDGELSAACVDMDEPILHAQAIPADLPMSHVESEDCNCVCEEAIDSPWGSFSFTCVSMGNPHAVCFLENLESLPDEWFLTSEKTLATFDLARIGSYFESHEAFPAKSNIEFIVIEPDGLHMRVYERGCGETLACGTGACASLVAAVLTGRSQRHNSVHLLGGTLDVEWSRKTNHVLMSGPAQRSFVGSVIV